MITQKHFAAALGFAFAAVWIGSSLGDAILCLVGAAAFYAIASFMQGELDLGDLQERLRGGTQAPAAASRPVRARPRVR